MSIVITRCAEGLSLNAGIREVLLGEDGKPLLFESADKAREYLVSQGCEDIIDDVEFVDHSKIAMADVAIH